MDFPWKGSTRGGFPYKYASLCLLSSIPLWYGLCFGSHFGYPISWVSTQAESNRWTLQLISSLLAHTNIIEYPINIHSSKVAKHDYLQDFMSIYLFTLLYYTIVDPIHLADVYHVYLIDTLVPGAHQTLIFLMNSWWTPRIQSAAFT